MKTEEEAESEAKMEEAVDTIIAKLKAWLVSNLHKVETGYYEDEDEEEDEDEDEDGDVDAEDEEIRALYLVLTSGDHTRWDYGCYEGEGDDWWNDPDNQEWIFEHEYP